MIVTSDSVIREYGMLPEHAHKLVEFVQRMYRRKLLLMIVRAGKEAALRHHASPHILPKPLHIKDKVCPALGYVTVKGRMYYSDYDLQGAFERAGRGYIRLVTGQHEPLGKKWTPQQDVKDVATNSAGLNEFLRVLNYHVLGRGTPRLKWMFRHGANDEYVKNDGTPGRYPEQGERFLAFEASGSSGQIRAINSRGELAAYYMSAGLPWIYV